MLTSRTFTAADAFPTDPPNPTLEERCQWAADAERAYRICAVHRPTCCCLSCVRGRTAPEVRAAEIDAAVDRIWSNIVGTDAAAVEARRTFTAPLTQPCVICRDECLEGHLNDAGRCEDCAELALRQERGRLR